MTEQEPKNWAMVCMRYLLPKKTNLMAEPTHQLNEYQQSPYN